MRIQSGILLTMGGERYENGYVDAENGKITAFGSMNDAPVYSGETYDAEGGYILPGLIDAHTHIGISEEGLRWEGEDCNEATDPVTPDMRAVDGINPFEYHVCYILLIRQYPKHGGQALRRSRYLPEVQMS